MRGRKYRKQQERGNRLPRIRRGRVNGRRWRRKIRKKEENVNHNGKKESMRGRKHRKEQGRGNTLPRIRRERVEARTKTGKANTPKKKRSVWP